MEATDASSAIAAITDRVLAATALPLEAFDFFYEQVGPGALPLLHRPFDWGRDAPADFERGAGPRAFPPIVGYGRGRRLLDEATERQLRAEDALRHRRQVESVDWWGHTREWTAILACGHRLKLGGPVQLGRLLPCPECAA